MQNVIAVNVNLFGGIRSDHDYYFGVEFNLNSLMAAYRLATDTSTAMVQVLAAKVERRGWSNVDAIAASLDSARHERPELLAVPFDMVVASSVCAFLDDYPSTVAILASLLTPGGAFVQWDWELNAKDDESFGLTRSQVADALAAAHLVRISVGTAFEVDVDGERVSPLVGVGNAAR